MNETKLTVTIDGNAYTYEKGTPYRKIAEDFRETKDHDIVLVTERTAPGAPSHPEKRLCDRFCDHSG